MNNQVAASFKKEFLLFSRTGKLLIICIVFIAFAILEPLLIKGMKAFSVWYDQVITTVSEETDTEMSINMESLMDTAYGEEPTTSIGVLQACSDFQAIDLFVLLIVLNLAAGGEQKKRSTIIPSCSGLRSFSYTFPKFIIYPIFAFLITIVAMLCSYICSILIFTINDLSIFHVLLSGCFMGLYLAFFTTVHLFIGISTSRPAVSAIICIAASMILPSLLTIMQIADKFNPFGLINFSLGVIQSARYETPLFNMYKPENILLTVLITLILMTIMFFLTLFIQTARKVENRGGNILF